VDKDEYEAVAWYRKAAEQGYASAQKNLGFAFEYGRGALQDAGEAARWYEKAARQGDAWGQRNIARMLREGRGGLARNVVLAHPCLAKPGQRGQESAPQGRGRARRVRPRAQPGAGCRCAALGARMEARHRPRHTKSQGGDLVGARRMSRIAEAGPSRCCRPFGP